MATTNSTIICFISILGNNRSIQCSSPVARQNLVRDGFQKATYDEDLPGR